MVNKYISKQKRNERKKKTWLCWIFFCGKNEEIKKDGKLGFFCKKEKVNKEKENSRYFEENEETKCVKFLFDLFAFFLEFTFLVKK